MMMQKKKRLLIGLLLTIAVGSKAMDNAHFYKAANLHKQSTVCWFDEIEKYDTWD